MLKGFLNLPWFFWAVVALVFSIIWVYVGPHTKLTPTPGFRYFIIRWGHALTWLLLAISFALRGMGPDLNGGSSFFALAGGVMYLLFILMAFVVR